ncbi:hypothetical protein HHL08_18780 [Sphingobium sp. AR-3-1]|uniref:Uncharacterized protein n=1 Tax=Sphingobium psychrophilum TaxID=2728834 RepID=A0A7X9WYC4_9SPHN|nr:hypothetical protein [Sphingobium psychrophilum]NML12165.1 hypothetical protein [Sphingobium psychrophilum]
MREQVPELALAQLFDGNLRYVRGILGAKGLPHGVGFLVEFAAIGFDLREPFAIGHFGHDVYPSAEGLPAALHYSHREDICNAILGPAGAGEEKEPPAGGSPPFPGRGCAARKALRRKDARLVAVCNAPYARVLRARIASLSEVFHKFPV